MNTFRSYFPHFFTLFLAKLASSRHFLVKSAIFSLFIVKSAFFAHSCVKPAFFAHFWSALVVRFVHISKTVKKYVRGKFSTYLCPWGKPQGLKIVLPVLVLESPQSEESGAFHVCLDSLGMYQRFFGSMQGRLALHFLQCHFLHWNPDLFFRLNLPLLAFFCRRLMFVSSFSCCDSGSTRGCLRWSLII